MALKSPFPRICIALGISDPNKLFEAADREAEASESFLEFRLDYLSRPEEVVMLPGVGDALRKLQRAGFKLFVVSNQSGVGRGYFTMADVGKVNERICDELEKEGVRFEKIYVAPEAPDQPTADAPPADQPTAEAPPSPPAAEEPKPAPAPPPAPPPVAPSDEEGDEKEPPTMTSGDPLAG